MGVVVTCLQEERSCLVTTFEKIYCAVGNPVCKMIFFIQMIGSGVKTVIADSVCSGISWVYAVVNEKTFVVI